MNITKDGGVVKKILKEGNGEHPLVGYIVKVNYSGKLTDGTVFDSSEGYPYSFELGTGSVIKGWDKGVLSMKIGEKAVLTIAPEYGYGKEDTPDIPANSTLIFEVELLSAQPNVKASADRVVSDMERLKLIREERENAAKLKEIEKKEKDAKKASQPVPVKGNDKGKKGAHKKQVKDKPVKHEKNAKEEKPATEETTTAAEGTPATTETTK